jgi:hypothetical protein
VIADDFLHDGLVEDEDGAPYPEHVQEIVRTLAQEIQGLRSERGEQRHRLRLQLDIEADEVEEIDWKLREIEMDLNSGKLSSYGVSAAPGRTCLHRFTEREG